MPLVALADGEQRDIKGATWVKPVDFFDLAQKKFNTNQIFKKPIVFVKGACNINDFTKAKDVQVVGMKLKPKWTQINTVLVIGPNCEEKEKGGGYINGESFCIYTNQGINRNYEVDYQYGDGNLSDVVTTNIHVSMAIKDLRLVQTKKGLGLHYAWNCKYKTNGEVCRKIRTEDGFNEERFPHHLEGSISKPASVEVDSLVSFFCDSRRLSMALWDSRTKKEHFHTDADGDEWEWTLRPIIIFEVEEILVADPGTVKTESVKPDSGHDGQGGVMQFLSDLLAWLSGEGDPLGLGEHTDATESAVVGVVGTLLALLLGGLAGGVGGAAPVVPPALPVDPVRFTPTNYPNYSERFITQQPDGDLVVTSPATGQSVHYYSNGDGTWFTDSGMTYTANDIEERLRFEAENAGVLQQDAQTAARNVAEQHSAWEAQNARDLERGYSDEQKEYMDWKQEQENQLKHEEYLDKMAWKYHVPPTDKAVMDAIKFEQTMNRIDADTYIDYAKQCDQFIKTLETVDKTCEIGVNILGSCVPGGGVVKNAYTFAKSTLVAASESVAEGKSASEGLAHVLVGMGDGALGVIQNEAGNLAGKGAFTMVKEWGINVITEDLKEGMKAIAEGKGIEDIGKTMIETTGKKTAEFGIGKAVGGVLGFFKDTAKASLNPDGVDMDQFSFNVSTAKRIDYWLNQTHRMALGGKTSTVNVSVGDKGINVWKGAGFKYFSGKVDTGGLAEGVIGEVLSRNNAYDWGGSVANQVSDKVASGVGSAMYGFDVAGETLADFAHQYGNFNALAAPFGKS